MFTEKKEAIRRRLLLSRYPRRRDAIFDDTNDHNPVVLEDCPACGGSGQCCAHESGSYVLDGCRSCEGSGTTLNLVRYFSEEKPTTKGTVDTSGWVECPGCHRRFATYDKRAWTGRRHRCGQKIDLEKSRDKL